MEEDKSKLVIKLDTSRDHCAGAASVFLMRRLAARAGCYAPGIQEHLFYEMIQGSYGFSLKQVDDWIRLHRGDLVALGYNFLARLGGEQTSDVQAWVADGRGFRGAVLGTNRETLYGEQLVGSTYHSVALTYNDPTSGIPDEALGNSVVMVDPWPHDSIKFLKPPTTLDRAHRDQNYTTLLLFWAGYG